MLELFIQLKKGIKRFKATVVVFLKTNVLDPFKL